MQRIIIGNFGNHSLAVMQALLERGLQALHFVYVETGWAAAGWPERVLACSNYARSQGVIVHPLKAKASFSELVIDRKQFPSPKFQWCASFLKGLRIIEQLDACDPACEAIIVSGKRRRDSKRYANLQEFEYDNDYYQGRTLWHPLWQLSDSDFVQLIQRTGFQLLTQQSLECSPCIHAGPEELDQQSRARLEALEQQIGQRMHQKPLNRIDSDFSRGIKGQGLQYLDRGCGAPWGCGE